MDITIRETKKLPQEQIIALYNANGWSAATKPEQLCQALAHSHRVVSAWEEERLIDLGNTISDGFMVVYYPHLLVHPDYQGQGIGQMIVGRMLETYKGFHMQMLTVDGRAIDFYQKMGFEKAGKTESMWIYARDEH